MLLAVVFGLMLAPGEPLEPWHLIRTFRCDFTESEGRRTSPEGITTPAKREVFADFLIDSVDYEQRSARFVASGSSTVLVFDGPTTVSFLEQATIGGNVNMLSIFKRTVTRGDIYKAVFSRHSVLTTGDLTVSQSYGTCRALLSF